LAPGGDNYEIFPNEWKHFQSPTCFRTIEWGKYICNTTKPASIYKHNNRRTIFVQSYINAYNTAFNQEIASFKGNYQAALYEYSPFTYCDVNSNFVPGTFGYDEEYNNGNNGETFRVGYLISSINNYFGAPYLFVSAGSGGGSGFMYLDWIIVTYGVPYVLSIS